MFPLTLSYEDIANLAINHDPRAAYWLSRPRNPKRPVSYPISLSFESGTPNVPLEAEFPTVGSDFLVTDLIFDVAMPERFGAGNVFGDEANLARSKQPGINARLTVQGGFLQYVVGCESIPIQMLARHATSYANDRWVGCWTLMWPERPSLYAFLTQALSESSLPYILNVTLRGYVLGCQQFNRISREEALRRLSEEGIIVAGPTSLGPGTRLGALPRPDFGAEE